MEDTVPEPAPREFGKEALDGIEPRTRGWREVESPAWMTVEAGADLVLLVRRVIVEDHVDGLVRRHLALDAVEEADELLVAVALHVLPDDRSIQNVERREQRGRAVAFVVMGHGAGAALLYRQAGLSAVECLDLRLSIGCTTAWAGGSTYKPTISASFSAKAGSFESLKFRQRCGLRPWAFQIACTVDAATPAALAIARSVQWVASCGGGCCV